MEFCGFEDFESLSPLGCGPNLASLVFLFNIWASSGCVDGNGNVLSALKKHLVFFPVHEVVAVLLFVRDRSLSVVMSTTITFMIKSCLLLSWVLSFFKFKS